MMLSKDYLLFRYIVFKQCMRRVIPMSTSKQHYLNSENF